MLLTGLLLGCTSTPPPLDLTPTDTPVHSESGHTGMMSGHSAKVDQLNDAQWLCSFTQARTTYSLYTPGGTDGVGEAILDCRSCGVPMESHPLPTASVGGGAGYELTVSPGAYQPGLFTAVPGCDVFLRADSRFHAIILAVGREFCMTRHVVSDDRFQYVWWDCGLWPNPPEL